MVRVHDFMHVHSFLAFDFAYSPLEFKLVLDGRKIFLLNVLKGLTTLEEEKLNRLKKFF